MGQDRLGNGTTIGIKMSGDPTYTLIDRAVDITPPDQTDNMVEAPTLTDTDGIAEKVKGSMAGGDLAFNINVKNPADAGLVMLKAAKESDEEVSFEITYLSGAKKQLNRVIVYKCALSSIGRDALLSYAVAGSCNAKTVDVAAGV